MIVLQKIYTIFVFAAMSLWVVGSVGAQQITAPTTPTTRNPQPTQSDLIESESSVQTPSGSEILNEGDAQIDFGGAKPLPSSVEEAPSLARVWISIFGGLIVAIVLTYGLSRISAADSKRQNTISDSKPKATNKKSKGAPLAGSYSAPVNATKKPLSKKKKRRSKKKSAKK